VTDQTIEISLIVPALNEEDNLEELVKGVESVIKRHQLATEVLIVDDASTDNTFVRATCLAENYPFVKPLHKGPPRGMGLSIWYGMQHAQGKVGVIIMADHVDPIDTIPIFRDKIIKEGYDLVLLSRWTNSGDTENIPPIYRFYQRGFRFLSRLLLGIKIQDITYAYRGFNMDFIRSIGLMSHGFNISPEITFRTYYAGGKICEVPGRQGRRYRGVSKFLFSRAYLEYGGVLFRAFVCRVTGYWPK
jgi:glycosyltransferase involved in cell wall biosynthesis